MQLGLMIAKLEQIEQQHGGDLPVQYDFGRTQPEDLDSWRGIYAELALGWKVTQYGDEPMTVTKLLELLRSARGATFRGYKGGDYTMGDHTRVHMDNYGECTSTSIAMITTDSYSVTIHTQNEAVL